MAGTHTHTRTLAHARTHAHTGTGTRTQGGLTLVEVLVSLAIFAVIGAAGLSVLQAVLRTERTAGPRLMQLAQLERALHLLTRDAQQVGWGGLTSDGQILVLDRGDGTRTAWRLDTASGRLLRLPAGATAQALVDHVGAVEWRLLPTPGAAWTRRWPPAEAQLGSLPAALELRLTLAPPLPGEQRLSGTVNRLVVLPAGPAP